MQASTNHLGPDMASFSKFKGTCCAFDVHLTGGETMIERVIITVLEWVPGQFPSNTTLLFFPSTVDKYDLGVPVKVENGQLLISQAGLASIISHGLAMTDLDKNPWFVNAPGWDSAGWAKVGPIRTCLRKVLQEESDESLRQSFFAFYHQRERAGLEHQRITLNSVGQAVRTSISDDLLRLWQLVEYLARHADSIMHRPTKKRKWYKEFEYPRRPRKPKRRRRGRAIPLTYGPMAPYE